MKNTLFLLWFEGVKPELLSQVPTLARMAAAGVDLRLTPLPLAEKGLGYYQTFTGMGLGKLGRFDVVRPEGYGTFEESGIPEGALGRLLPEVLRTRKLAVTSIEIAHKDGPGKLVGQVSDCTMVRLLGMEHASNAELDVVVRRCYELAGPGTHMVVLSDVWSAPAHTLANINDFLADVGLLEVAEPRSRETVSWSETLAYGLGNGQVWINLRGREAHGLVGAGKEYQEVCDALANELFLSWLDPETDKPIVERVLRKEQAYSGDYLFKAPDLVVVYHPGYAASPKAIALDFDGASLLKLPASPSDVASASPAYARMIACGPALAQGYSGSAQLVDVLPSLVYLLGQPVPMHVDGNVFLPMFARDYQQQKAVERAAYDDGLLSGEEEGLIVDRLRDLGYLG